jgi:Fic family protein
VTPPAIKYPKFDFDSDLTRAIIELERARASLRHGSTPDSVYNELAALSRLLTSIMSARIEGNRTSILDAVSGAVEQRHSDAAFPDEGVEEIMNLQRAVDFIDENTSRMPIGNLFIRELHRIAVDGLTREGDRTPGAYRLEEVTIGQSAHRPPWPADVPDHMNELIDFIAEDVEPQKQLLQVAIAHHRFLWIHPFGNGNGRVARLLTYAMLRRQGVTADGGLRAINPTAVFGADRGTYYDHLERADTLTDDGILEWCTYLLDGLASDVVKAMRLIDADFVIDELLIPSVERLRRSGGLTDSEARALTITAERTVIAASDLVEVFPGTKSHRSGAIRRLIDRGLLERHPENSRKYRLVLSPNDLTIHLVHRLDRVGLLPKILAEDPI